MEWFNPFEGGGSGGGGTPVDTSIFATTLEVSLNSETSTLVAQIKNKFGTVLGEPQEVPMPFDSMIISGRYDSENKEVVLIAEDESEVSFSIASLIEGLQEEITVNNKLDIELIDCNNSHYKVIWTGTSQEYEAAAQTIPEGIPVLKTDDDDIDLVPTQNSQNLVYSGGIYTFVVQGLAGKANTSDLGTAASKDVPVSGNASTTQVVMGDDTRLTDSRPASDVSEWAKALTKPSYDYSEIDNAPAVNNATLTIQKNGTAVDTFTANASVDKTINITVPTSAADVSALPASTKYGSSVLMEINSSTFVVTLTLKDQDGNTLGTAQTIDLPLESVVVGGSYDDSTKKVILTLQNGNTVEFSVADLVAGLQSEITSSNKLSADLVDDTSATHKFATAAQLSQIATNTSDIANKVDKVSGKQLSTEDYTTAEKTKLGGIEAEANKTVVDSALDGTSTNPVQNKVVKAALDLKANTADLGTAASKDVPVSGDAAATEVVMGNDSRLAYIDANGNLWIGNTQIWELIDDVSYAALANKNNRLYFVYPASS